LTEEERAFAGRLRDHVQAIASREHNLDHPAAYESAATYIEEALAKAGYISSGMELFPATDQQQLEFIKLVIDRCDYYVVIVGGRYGSLADDNVSFTEKEYEYAISKKIPVLAFLHAYPEKIEVGKTDQNEEKSKRLRAFRERLANGRIAVDSSHAVRLIPVMAKRPKEKKEDWLKVHFLNS